MPKLEWILQVTVQNVYLLSPSEHWVYLLRYAEQLMPIEVSQSFPNEEIAEAAGVLQMISQTLAQRLLYNPRLKFQRDNARAWVPRSSMVHMDSIRVLLHSETQIDSREFPGQLSACDPQ
jgi:hypothetical protein